MRNKDCILTKPIDSTDQKKSFHFYSRRQIIPNFLEMQKAPKRKRRRIASQPETKHPAIPRPRKRNGRGGLPVLAVSGGWTGCSLAGAGRRRCGAGPPRRRTRGRSRRFRAAGAVLHNPGSDLVVGSGDGSYCIWELNAAAASATPNARAPNCMYSATATNGGD